MTYKVLFNFWVLFTILTQFNNIIHDSLNQNIKINLKNDVIEFAGIVVRTKEQVKDDYFTYQLDYIYILLAKCEMFNKYLATVLPSK